MDKIKESIGLERQRKLIIKRYVKELLCLAFSYLDIPDGKRAASKASNRANVNPSKLTINSCLLVQ